MVRDPSIAHHAIGGVNGPPATKLLHLPLPLSLACHSERSEEPPYFAFAVELPLGLERGFSPASMPAAKRPTALPKAGAKPEGRSD
jgi:hypothetical protein